MWTYHCYMCELGAHFHVTGQNYLLPLHIGLLATCLASYKTVIALDCLQILLCGTWSLVNELCCRLKYSISLVDKVNNRLFVITVQFANI